MRTNVGHITNVEICDRRIRRGENYPNRLSRSNGPLTDNITYYVRPRVSGTDTSYKHICVVKCYNKFRMMVAIEDTRELIPQDVQDAGQVMHDAWGCVSQLSYIDMLML